MNRPRRTTRDVIHGFSKATAGVAVSTLRRLDGMVRLFPLFAVMFFVAVLVLGMIGHRQLHATADVSNPKVFWDDLNGTLQRFALNGPKMDAGTLPGTYVIARFPSWTRNVACAGTLRWNHTCAVWRRLLDARLPIPAVSGSSSMPSGSPVGVGPKLARS